MLKNKEDNIRVIIMKKYTIDFFKKDFNDKGYNLLTHNCSDSTKEALEKATGIKYNTFLFTTPGDTKDFAKDKLKGKDTDKGVLIPWNKKMSDNLIGFHKHGIKFIGY